MEYLSPPSIPEFFTKELKNIVPKTPNGLPYLRFVWGCDRKEFINGEMLCRYPDSENKYVGAPFWFLEGWQPSDIYDEAEWKLNEEVLGEFPREGVWDFIAVVRTDDYKFLNLGHKALQMAREWRFWKARNRKESIEELLANRQKIKDLQEKRWKEAKAKIQEEFLEQFTRAEVDDARNAVSTVGKLPKLRKTEGGIYLPDKIWN